MKSIKEILNTSEKYSNIFMGYWYRDFYIKPTFKNSVVFNIYSPDQSFRMVYQWNFKSLSEAIKFIDLHYSDLKKWTLL